MDSDRENPTTYHDPNEAQRRDRALLLRAVRAAFFILLITFAALAILRSGVGGTAAQESVALQWGWYVLSALVLAGFAIGVDVLTPHKRVSTVLAILVGVIAGLLATLALGFIVDLVLASWIEKADALETLKPAVNTFKVLVGITFCYLGASTVLQTKDDFRLIIPYVEFARERRGPRPMILDSSVLIDARIAEVASSQLIQSPLIVPGFVIVELQALADSGDALKRAKGRRGLDVVARLQRTAGVSVTVDESEVAGVGADQKLVELARRLSGIVVTTDVALARVAGIQGLVTVNVNEVASAVRPTFVTGEALTVRLIRPGEHAGQGVGYLADGTMVVAEDGSGAIGQTVTLTVTSSLQTAAGRLIFGRMGMDGKAGGGEPARAAESPADLPAGESVSNEPAPEPPASPAPRSPFPPNPPRSFRGGSPRNPRR